MSGPQINLERPQHRPDHQVSGVLIDMRAVDGVMGDLEQLGMDVSDVFVLHGPEGVRVFDIDGEAHGWWAHLVRSYKNLGGADAETFNNYNNALEHGQALVLVPSSAASTVEDIVEIIRRHGGAQINHYANGGMETIG